MFSCNFSEILNKTFLTKDLRPAAFVSVGKQTNSKKEMSNEKKALYK